MQYLGRVASVAVLGLGTAALFGCYAPAPPPEPPVATLTPTPVTPNYAPPQFGSTGPAVELPSNAGTTTVMIAPLAPPTPLPETPLPAPSPLAVWQAGHWSWSGAQYTWTPGHYAQRPWWNARWVPGVWQPGAGGWTWINGYWSPPQPG
jgi:hypothetical protein